MNSRTFLNCANGAFLALFVLFSANPDAALANEGAEARPHVVTSKPSSRLFQAPRRADAYKWLCGLKKVALTTKGISEDATPIANEFLKPVDVSIVSLAEATREGLPVLELNVRAQLLNKKIATANVELDLTEFIETKREPKITGRSTTWRVTGSRFNYSGKDTDADKEAERVATTQAIRDSFKTLAQDVDDARIVEQTRKFDIPDYLETGNEMTTPLSKTSSLNTPESEKRN